MEPMRRGGGSWLGFWGGCDWWKASPNNLRAFHSVEDTPQQPADQIQRLLVGIQIEQPTPYMIGHGLKPSVANLTAVIVTD